MEIAAYLHHDAPAMLILSRLGLPGSRAELFQGPIGGGLNRVSRRVHLGSLLQKPHRGPIAALANGSQRLRLSQIAVIFLKSLQKEANQVTLLRISQPA